MRWRKNAPRIWGRNYAGGNTHFITVCTQDRERLFGEIHSGRMFLNPFGRVVESTWMDLARRYPYLVLDSYVVMPDHFHGILKYSIPHIPIPIPVNPSPYPVRDGGRGGSRPAPASADGQIVGGRDHVEMVPMEPVKDLSSVMGAFKTVSSKQINALRATPGIPVWQRGFNDRPIWSRKILSVVRNYIQKNPERWRLPLTSPAPTSTFSPAAPPSRPSN